MIARLSARRAGMPYVGGAGPGGDPGLPRRAPSVNVLASAATFAAGLWLLVGDGGVGDYAIVDEFNIVFIIINTLVGFTTALFSASYIGHEIETGRLSPLLRAILSRHVPGDDGLDERRPYRQQHRRDVGRAGAGDADHRGDGRALPHAAGDRGGMEILHPGQRRHIARLLRHHPDLSRGPAGAGRGRAGDDLEPAAGRRRAAWTRRSSTSPSSSC